MKPCFKCGEQKELSEFYQHPQMPDGHLNKCKECTKRDVRENRKAKIDYYRAYDRERGCRLTNEYHREYRKRFPKKQAAKRKVAYEVRKGTLVAEPCEKCGAEPTHAHHDDYSKKLNVRWLCAACHKAWHTEHGEGANAT